MELNNASELGSRTDIINNIQLFTELFKIFIPVIAILVIIITVTFIHKLLKFREKQKIKENKRKKAMQKQKEAKQRQLNRLFEDDEFMFKQLENADEPLDKRPYHSLDLSFDRYGKVIKQ